MLETFKNLIKAKKKLFLYGGILVCMVVVVLPFVCFSTHKDNNEKSKDETSHCCSTCEVANPETIEIPSIDATDEVISKEQNEKGLEEKDPDPTPQEIYVEDIPKNEYKSETKPKKQQVVQEISDDTPPKETSSTNESSTKETEKNTQKEKEHDQKISEDNNQHNKGSDDSKEYVYIPGFGQVEYHGNVAVGRTVGEEGDELTGNLVGSMD